MGAKEWQRAVNHYEQALLRAENDISEAQACYGVRSPGFNQSIKISMHCYCILVSAADRTLLARHRRRHKCAKVDGARGDGTKDGGNEHAACAAIPS